MSSSLNFWLSVHGPVAHADANPENGGALNLHFGEYSLPRIAIFTNNAAMSIDLADAINAVLAKHRQPIAEAAE